MNEDWYEKEVKVIQYIHNIPTKEAFDKHIITLPSQGNIYDQKFFYFLLNEIWRLTHREEGRDYSDFSKAVELGLM